MHYILNFAEFQQIVYFFDRIHKKGTEKSLKFFNPFFRFFDTLFLIGHFHIVLHLFRPYLGIGQTYVFALFQF